VFGDYAAPRDRQTIPAASPIKVVGMASSTELADSSGTATTLLLDQGDQKDLRRVTP
jgi:hypothetical protein